MGNHLFVYMCGTRKPQIITCPAQPADGGYTISLQSLSANLQNVGNSLLIRIGQTQAVLLDLLSHFKNSHVFWNRSCEPAALESEHRVLTLLEAKKVQGTVFYGNNLVDPARIKTQTQKPYRVFTPFWKRLQSQLTLSPPLPAPKTLPPASHRQPQIQPGRFPSFASDD